jgi:hypothetical protein
MGNCVSALAQQYSSATPASPLLHFLKQKYGAVQKVITSTSFIINIFVELRNLEVACNRAVSVLRCHSECGLM